MILVKYGKIGTTETTLCTSKEIGRSLGNDWVEMIGEKPNDGKAYIIDKKGNWILSLKTDIVQSQRRDRIVTEYPYYRQLEAIMDYMAGDQSKVNTFIEFKQQLRELLPYPTEEAEVTQEEKKTIVVGKGKK